MRLSPRALRLAAALLGAGGCRAAAPPIAPTTAWERVGDGITCGVSGLAPAPAADGAARLVLVHDNKSAGEPRVATLTLDGHATYRPVAWRYDVALRARHAALLGAAPDSLPVDLEAVAPVPGRGGAFYGVTSRGVVYRFALTAGGPAGDSAVVEAVFALAPPAPSDSLAALANYEGFVALPRGDGTVLGIWADRGADARPGVLRWGVLDPARGVVAPTVLDSVRVPWPATPEVRHVSDLALRGDTLLATAASDAGDAGPFASAVYRLGRVSVDAGVPRLRRATDGQPPAPLLRLDGRKAEAIAVLPGAPRRAASIVLGTDDELQGGAILRVTLPRSGGDGAAVPPGSGEPRATHACTPAPGGTARP
jgi:hypothetical protein